MKGLASRPSAFSYDPVQRYKMELPNAWAEGEYKSAREREAAGLIPAASSSLSSSLLLVRNRGRDLRFGAGHCPLHARALILRGNEGHGIELAAQSAGDLSNLVL